MAKYLDDHSKRSNKTRIFIFTVTKYFEAAADIITDLTMAVARLEGRLEERPTLPPHLEQTQRATYSKVVGETSRKSSRPTRPPPTKPPEQRAKPPDRPVPPTPAVLTPGTAVWTEVRSRKNKQKPSDQRPTVRSQLGVFPRRRQRPAQTMLISSTDVEAPPDQLRRLLTETVDPTRDGIRVRRFQQTPSGKLLVITHSQADTDRLSRHPCLTSRGLQVLKTTKKPKIILYDAPASMSEPDLKLAIWRQNPRLHTNLQETTFCEAITDCHAYPSKRPGVVKWVLEVTPQNRHAVRQSSTLYVG